MFNYIQTESKQQVTAYVMYTRGGVFKKIEVEIYVDEDGIHMDCSDMLCVVRQNTSDNGFRIFPYVEETIK